MDHMQHLLVRASDPNATSIHPNAPETAAVISGHALMATCPPESHILNNPDDPYPCQMPDVTMPDLMRLLDLSNRLPLDGEITPIMAWAMVLREPRFGELTREDVEALKGDLTGKVRCYGYALIYFLLLASDIFCITCRNELKLS